MVIGSANAGIITNFTDGYDVSNWTASLDGGAIDTSGAPTTILSISSNDGRNGPAYTDFTIASLGDGLVSFDWSYSTIDWGVDYDNFGYILNGAYTQLSYDAPSSGSASFIVLAGDVFGFRSYSSDTLFGSSTTVISNFSAPSAVPEPASIALLSLGLAGIGFSRKKKAA